MPRNIYFPRHAERAWKKWAKCLKLQFISIVAILNKTVVNSFSLLLKTAIVNKNGPLYLVFPPHQLQYVIWLWKGMIRIMTYIYLPLSTPVFTSVGVVVVQRPNVHLVRYKLCLRSSKKLHYIVEVASKSGITN